MLWPVCSRFSAQGVQASAKYCRGDSSLSAQGVQGAVYLEMGAVSSALKALLLRV